MTFSKVFTLHGIHIDSLICLLWCITGILGLWGTTWFLPWVALANAIIAGHKKWEYWVDYE